MEFNPNTHLVIIDTLKKEEAQAFIFFLSEEIDRHELAIVDAEVIINTNSMLVPFYKSAILHHQEDICQARELIAIVKEKYND